MASEKLEGLPWYKEETPSSHMVSTCAELPSVTLFSWVLSGKAAGGCCKWKLLSHQEEDWPCKLSLQWAQKMYLLGITIFWDYLIMNNWISGHSFSSFDQNASFWSQITSVLLAWTKLVDALELPCFITLKVYTEQLLQLGSCLKG